MVRFYRALEDINKGQFVKLATKPNLIKLAAYPDDKDFLGVAAVDIRKNTKVPAKKLRPYKPTDLKEPEPEPMEVEEGSNPLSEVVEQQLVEDEETEITHEVLHVGGQELAEVEVVEPEEDTVLEEETSDSEETVESEEESEEEEKVPWWRK